MPKFVFIASSMRSGSTLLKALLATRNEVVDIKETPFDEIKQFSYFTNEKIIVLKYPSHFHTVSDYPKYPNIPSKKIVLVRSPYDTSISLIKMMKEDNRYDKILDYDTLIYYWNLTYYNVLNSTFYQDGHESAMDCYLVRYETLIKNPIAETSKLFKFIGVKNKSGTENYNQPKDYKWEWGFDDGGEVIKTLKVQNSKVQRKDDKLLKIIQYNDATQELLVAMGYENILPELII